MTTTPKAEQGVYYHPSDSPGFLVRVFIDIVDVIVIIAIITGCVAMGLQSEQRQYLGALLIVGFILVWVYMVPVKRSIGTLGYRLLGYRIVDLQGNRPSLFRLTGRTFLPLIFNSLVDLIYLSSDSGRQALRDKISGTYMIRRDAKPAGHGPFVYSRTFFFNYNIFYREVRRDH